jgi:hypothetical protein
MQVENIGALAELAALNLAELDLSSNPVAEGLDRIQVGSCDTCRGRLALRAGGQGAVSDARWAVGRRIDRSPHWCP